jgi:TatD DNase family protein
VVAIGEIGLDYHYDFSPRDVQKRVFETQIRLALDLDLPIIVHDREAHADTMALLQKYRPAVSCTAIPAALKWQRKS